MTAATTALHDQAAAAIRDAGRAMLGLAALTDRPIHWTTSTPGPVGDRLGEWFDTGGDGIARCPHLGNKGPQVVLGMLHRPGDLWCVHCGPAAITADAAARPSTCDACGQNASRFHELLLQVASLIIAGNTCTSCTRLAGGAS